MASTLFITIFLFVCLIYHFVLGQGFGAFNYTSKVKAYKLQLTNEFVNSKFVQKHVCVSFFYLSCHLFKKTFIKINLNSNVLSIRLPNKHPRIIPKCYYLRNLLAYPELKLGLKILSLNQLYDIKFYLIKIQMELLHDKLTNPALKCPIKSRTYCMCKVLLLGKILNINWKSFSQCCLINLIHVHVFVDILTIIQIFI